MRRGDFLRRSLLVPVLLAAFFPVRAAARTWIVPGVISGIGANGVRFSTDVTLVNVDAFAAAVTVLPIAGPGGPIRDPLGLVLRPGEAHLLAIDWGLPRGGALRVSAPVDLLVFARLNAELPTVSANPLPPPRRASSLPAIELDRLLGAGETGHSQWVTHSQDLSAGSRTNVAVVFSEPGGGAAKVTLFDDAGMALGVVAWDTASAAFFQTSVGALTRKDVPIGRVAIEVTRGSACGYTGTVDNVSGDVTIASADRAPAAPASGTVNLVSNGVAQIVGRNGRLWHTDARLANPGSKDVTVNASLIRPVSVDPQTASLTIPAGHTAAIRDIVQLLFGVSVLTSGTVLWEANGPLLAATRMRTGDVSVAALASAVVQAVPLYAFPTNADEPAVLADLRQDARSRTNLSAAAGPGGAQFVFDLYDESGLSIASSRQSLAPLGWGEYGLDQLFPGVAPARGRVRVHVETGSVSVTAFISDNVDDDLVAFEAMPRPVRLPPLSPLLPVGTWGGAPNAIDHLVVDSGSISLFRFCQSGVFPQPSSLDRDGRFSVIGTYVSQIGPSIQFDAILMGQTDGHAATVRVAPIDPRITFVDTSPERFVLGAPFTPFTGLCPIEY